MGVFLQPPGNCPDQQIPADPGRRLDIEEFRPPLPKRHRVEIAQACDLVSEISVASHRLKPRRSGTGVLPSRNAPTAAEGQGVSSQSPTESRARYGPANPSLPGAL